MSALVDALCTFRWAAMPWPPWCRLTPASPARVGTSLIAQQLGELELGGPHLATPTLLP